MIKVPYYNKLGKKEQDLSLNLNLKSNHHYRSLLHQVFRAQELSKLVPSSHSKTRGERRGGGRKPWRQKGTGRARVGSVRTPIWRKGGIIFGPRSDKNFKICIPKNFKILARNIAINDRAANKKILVFEKLPSKLEKTKEAEAWLSKLPLGDGSIMLITGGNKPRAFSNLPYLKICVKGSFGLSDIIKNDFILMEKDVFDKNYPRKVLTTTAAGKPK